MFKERGLVVRQAKRMVQDRSEWRIFVRGNAWGVAPGNEPLTLTRCMVVGCHSYMKHLNRGSPFVAEPTT